MPASRASPEPPPSSLAFRPRCIMIWLSLPLLLIVNQVRGGCAGETRRERGPTCCLRAPGTPPPVPPLRQMDWTDENNVFMARVSYAVVQVCVLGAWWLIQQKAQSLPKGRTMWVPDPVKNNALMKMLGGSGGKVEYIKTTEGEWQQQKAGEGLQGALTSGGMMLAMSLYMGLITPLAMQVVISPMTLFNNPLFRKTLLGGWGLSPRPFDERWADPEQFESDAEAGLTLAGDAGGSSAAAGMSAAVLTGIEAECEEAIFRTWERRQEPLDIGVAESLLKAGGKLTHRTQEEGWTLLMVACGNPSQHQPALRKLLVLGAPLGQVDEDGWTALHWAAYHGAADTVNTITQWAASSGHVSSLKDALRVESKQGTTPLQLAIAEGHKVTAAALEKAASVESSAEEKVEELD